MRLSVAVLALLGAAGLAGACMKTPTESSASLVGVWGSATAGLAVTDTGGTLRILSSGTCYGSYADVTGPVPAPTFDVAGTFTQLTGAFPGKIQYAAQLSGEVTADSLVVTVGVASLQETLGPYRLAHGVSNSWTACAFP